MIRIVGIIQILSIFKSQFHHSLCPLMDSSTIRQRSIAKRAHTNNIRCLFVSFLSVQATRRLMIDAIPPKRINEPKIQIWSAADDKCERSTNHFIGARLYSIKIIRHSGFVTFISPPIHNSFLPLRVAVQERSFGNYEKTRVSLSITEHRSHRYNQIFAQTTRLFT